MQSKSEIIRVVRDESNFDRACDHAYDLALVQLGVDEDELPNDKRFHGKEFDVHVQFQKYEHVGSKVGHEHVYTFEAWLQGV